MRLQPLYLLFSVCALFLPVDIQATEPGQNYACSQGKHGSLLDGWSSEKFSLPPGFAPGLPKGVESLRFSPGWNKPGNEGFWSYAFILWIEEATPSAKRIDFLLEEYYKGLLTMFGGDKQDLSATPPKVEVRQIAKGKYEAKMSAIDAFATFKPIEIRILVDSISEGNKRSSLRIRLSPQPKTHPIWKSLEAAIADIKAKDSPKSV